MRPALLLTCCFMVFSLAGCEGALDPFQRPGNWSATGASNKNIAAQAAYKSDLINGRSEPGSNGVAAVAGVEKAMSGGTASGLQTTVTPTASSASINVGQ